MQDSIDVCYIATNSNMPKVKNNRFLKYEEKDFFCSADKFFLSDKKNKLDNPICLNYITNNLDTKCLISEDKFEVVRFLKIWCKIHGFSFESTYIRPECKYTVFPYSLTKEYRSKLTGFKVFEYEKKSQPGKYIALARSKEYLKDEVGDFRVVERKDIKDIDLIQVVVKDESKVDKFSAKTKSVSIINYLTKEDGITIRATPNYTKRSFTIRKYKNKKLIKKYKTSNLGRLRFEMFKKNTESEWLYLTENGRSYIYP